jgi:hypothetical protein
LKTKVRGHALQKTRSERTPFARMLARVIGSTGHR